MRALRLAGVGIIASLTMLCPSAASADGAGVRIPEWLAWEEFLTAHPELEVLAGTEAAGTAGVAETATATCAEAAEICVPGALVAGSFLIGTGIGYYGAKWIWGTNDTRTYATAGATNGFAFRTDSPFVLPPSPGLVHEWPSNVRLQDVTDNPTRGMTIHEECRDSSNDVELHSGHLGFTYSVAAGSTFGWWGGGGTCYNAANQPGYWSELQVHLGANSLLGPTIWKWLYSPPKPWTVTTHVECTNSTGQTYIVDGPAIAVTPTAGQNVDIGLPSCAASDATGQPAVAWTTGGRAGEVGILQAAPIHHTTTRTGTATPPEPSADPSAPPQSDTGTIDDNEPDPAAKDAGKSCLAGAYSWNPVDWVFVPVKCALKWAFIPNSATVTSQMTELKTQWSTSLPGQAVAQATGLVGAVTSLGDGSSGCEGPGVTLPFSAIGMESQTLHPIAACTAPMSTVAHVVKLIVSIGIVLGAGWTVARLLAASLGLQIPSISSGDKE